MITISVNGRKATKTAGELITSGSVGMEVQFTFDSTWDGLSKIACFSGSEDRDQLPTNNVCKIPWECLKTSGRPVVVGVYGADGTGAVVIPTVYCNLGMVQRGAKPSNSSQAATPTAVDQMLGAAETCTEKATAAASSAAAAQSSAAAAVSTANAANETANSAKNTALNARTNASIAATSATTAASAATSAATAAQSVVDRANAGEFNGATGPRGPQGPQGEQGDSGAFIATAQGTTVTTFDEILAAYNAGKTIYCSRYKSTAISGTGARLMPLTYVIKSGDNACFVFVGVTSEVSADGAVDTRKVSYATCRPSGWTFELKNLLRTINGTEPDDAGNINVSGGGGGGGGSTAWADITGKPSTFPPAAHEHTVSQISDFPSIPTDNVELANGAGYITSAYHDGSKQNVIADLATIRSGAAAGATAVQPETGKSLFSGSYTDLTNQPILNVDIAGPFSDTELTRGYLKRASSGALSWVISDSSQNRVAAVSVSGLESIGLAGVVDTIYDTIGYGFSTAETLDAAIVDISTVSGGGSSMDNPSALTVPENANIFIVSFQRDDANTVRVFKNLALNTDGISALIDSKLGSLESYADTILEVL